MDYKHGPGNRKYEDFGNFNYGAVALAFGLSTGAALRGAGLVQILVNMYRKIQEGNLEDAKKYVAEHGLDFLGGAPYGDQPEDQKMIRQGFRYYKEIYLKKQSAKETSEKYREITETQRAIIVEELDSFLRSPRRIGEILGGK
ncbi:polymorphic toxin type 44 domain-containing protein [Solidesulfovibrio sp.]|uniref:polymorphic toxin type 44 domain-containing protein n=1 Tax=Solidesulfovibrio sp. TaxID=2910990 RepID=UPI002B21AA4A|nr:polymorphic toxin type 44 domain-containing protein [Solidesulfovibrio sp.]MEA4856905.1 polymorphic toxin type 44 domain-containing protein [Solidesulfovibrio sp.]